MKKKIIVSISTVLVLVVCALALVACGPSNLPDFMAKMVKADKVTTETYNEDGKVIARGVMNGDNSMTEMYDAEGKVVATSYIMKEGEKFFQYDKAGEGKWTRKESIAVPSVDDMLGEFGVSSEDAEDKIKEMIEKIFKEEDGKWYMSIGEETMKDSYYTVKSGTLAVYNKIGEEFKKVSSAKLKANSIKLPKEAADLKA